MIIKYMLIRPRHLRLQRVTHEEPTLSAIISIRPRRGESDLLHDSGFTGLLICLSVSHVPVFYTDGWRKLNVVLGGELGGPKKSCI